ncbi:AraC family transcriptional regulator [Sutcliffiella horikoshii]|uniref:AraC family transcriptional regulator n=2 Tax=Sutcliffiella horikoshii TaxID=79883 RepID=A0A5D4SWU6_9BACI|nr:AraC family transcriptional regulator [Sutcliffiella horikoshii]
MKEPLIKNLDNLKLTGFRVVCRGEEYPVEIPKASELLESRLPEIKNVKNGNVQYGSFIVDIHSEEEDGYWVGVEVEEFEDTPEGMVTMTVPAQRYASANYEGPTTGIFNAYEELHSWAAEQGYKRLKDKWHVEIFESWEDPNNIVVELLDTIE